MRRDSMELNAWKLITPRRIRCANGGYGGSLLAGQANVSSHFSCEILTGLILSNGTHAR
jgi:hypothetical protein